MANPPPFYRLGMSDGSGKGSGSTDQTPIDLRQEGYDEGYQEGGGLGAFRPGSVTYDDGATGLSWPAGDASVRTITFTTQGDGEAYLVRLAHSGADAQYFQIIGYTRGSETVDLSAGPIDVSNTPEYAIAVDDPNGAPTTITVSYEPKYKGSVSANMSVELYDGGKGELLDTITASHTMGNPFYQSVESDPNFLYVYDVGGVLPGTKLANQDIATPTPAGPGPTLRVKNQSGGESFSVVEKSFSAFTQIAIVDEGNDWATQPRPPGSTGISTRIWFGYVAIDLNQTGKRWLLGIDASLTNMPTVYFDKTNFGICNGTTEAVIVSIPHGGITGWYALSVVMDQTGDLPRYNALYVTQFSNGDTPLALGAITHGNVGSGIEPVNGGRGILSGYAPTIGSVLTGGSWQDHWLTGTAAMACFSTILTEPTMAAHVESIKDAM